MTLPKEIHASRHMYYDVAGIVQSIVDMDDTRTHDDVTLEEVLDFVLDYVYEDFSTLIAFEPILEDDQGNLLN